jgi:ABC-type Mn2+/Zn2+ transport system permease subunit
MHDGATRAEDVMEQIVEVLIGPFAADFMQRALVAGLMAALTCSLVGTWVVLRGLTFMGDALAHGVLPGIAVAYVVLGGGDVATTIGAALAAVVVIAGVNVVQRHSHLPEDAGIGLLFIGMLALGVMIISRGSGYFGDLLSFLFGAALGVAPGAITVQAIAAVIALLGVVVFHRAFLALSFDERKAQGLGLHPRVARIALLALIALAIISSFRTVGNLLVYGLLIAPPATASLLARRVPVMMTVSVGVGMLSVYVGLLFSYHLDLAAGAAMAGFAVAAFFVVLTVTEVSRAWRTRTARSGPGATPGQLVGEAPAAGGATPAAGQTTGH